jgi:hypothetical protein
MLELLQVQQEMRSENPARTEDPMRLAGSRKELIVNVSSGCEPATRTGSHTALLAPLPGCGIALRVYPVVSSAQPPATGCDTSGIFMEDDGPFRFFRLNQAGPVSIRDGA